MRIINIVENTIGEEENDEIDTNTKYPTGKI